jgi:predicted SprT family Zn-dependent metalloprotease
MKLEFKGVNDPALIAKMTDLVDIGIKRMQGHINETTEKLLRCMTIDLNPRMRSTAGRAWTSKHKIQMNWRLLKDKPADFESTFMHELAHMISVYQHGWTLGGGHGAKWQRVMELLGYPPERCHSLDVSALKQKRTKYLYRCVNANCKRHTSLYSLSSQRHVKNIKFMARGYLNGLYRCSACGKEIEYTLETIKS